MKWWYWLILELLIVLGVIAWVCFFPSSEFFPSREFEGDFMKGVIGFGLIYLIEFFRNIRRR